MLVYFKVFSMSIDVGKMKHRLWKKILKSYALLNQVHFCRVKSYEAFKKLFKYILSAVGLSKTYVYCCCCFLELKINYCYEMHILHIFFAFLMSLLRI